MPRAFPSIRENPDRILAGGPALASAEPRAAQLVGAPDDDREGAQQGELLEAEGPCPEDRLQRRHQHERGEEDDLRRDAPEEERVGEEADLP